VPVPRLGVVVAPERPPEALPAYAARVEELGFDDVWVVEDCFLSGGLVMAGQALASTRRIGVGVGLLPTLGRNPAIAAMEIAALARLHPGRLTVAFGHGVDAWMRQIGARPADRLVALREVVGAVRALLAGERVDVSGEVVQLDAVQLDQPPAEPPQLLIGTTGPRAMRMSAEIAGGVLLPEGASPAAIEWAARHAGPGAEVATYAWLSRGGDDLGRLRTAVDRWRELGLYPHLRRLGGVPDDAAPDDETLRRLAVAGDAGQCAQAIADLAAAGATRVALLPPPDGAEQHLEWFASEVLPLAGAA
jgi:5,10-methylenetetrahydromethanopterin reductase